MHLFNFYFFNVLIQLFMQIINKKKGINMRHELRKIGKNEYEVLIFLDDDAEFAMEPGEATYNPRSIRNL